MRQAWRMVRIARHTPITATFEEGCPRSFGRTIRPIMTNLLSHANQRVVHHLVTGIAIFVDPPAVVDLLLRLTMPKQNTVQDVDCVCAKETNGRSESKECGSHEQLLFSLR